jgi:hypothetical protein
VDQWRPAPRSRCETAGAAVAALGGPRWQVPLVDLLFGNGKPLEPEG